MRCVDLYNQAQSKWFEEMVTTTLVSEQRSLSIQGVVLGSPRGMLVGMRMMVEWRWP